MIVGIGTDIVAIARVRASLERHGDAFAERILAANEFDDYRAVRDGARFLAKRFAAKEAFAKAFGTGLRPPATLRAISVAHDDLGKPVYAFDVPLAQAMHARQWVAHLSISDEKESVVAFALIEHRGQSADAA
ncbi:holo-ACP synthase [Niveibacterium umoris]|uniref:Holo-[acyl-carrier-protein] synthase n=1 Tax=Niveibacterium umoris TaxID=1193620 RepID=A0A840BD00_9RHOO|nr:holo-ACP synthase [Niveibacterium umoris]MBB4010910.1 holo-[acyl-carrier protein] synthase [Niveibacterium umoris]